MKILKHVQPTDLIFIDIETVRAYDNFSDAPKPIQESWLYKVRHSAELEQGEADLLWLKKSALYAEFAKVVCISIGVVTKDGLRIKSLHNSSEKTLLGELTTILDKLPNKKLCGHSIKGFDIPFLMRRYIVHQLFIPDCLDIGGAKPWEVDVIDTLEIWKGSSWYSASLLNIAACLGVDSSKVDIDGSDTSECYYNDQIDRIVAYCERDVRCVYDIFMKLKYQ